MLLSTQKINENVFEFNYHCCGNTETSDDDKIFSNATHHPNI